MGESASKAVELDPDRPAKPENIGLSVALPADVSITTIEVTVGAVDGGDRGGVCDGDGGGEGVRVVVPRFRWGGAFLRVSSGKPWLMGPCASLAALEIWPET